jgi:hypothetical protein
VIILCPTILVKIGEIIIREPEKDETTGNRNIKNLRVKENILFYNGQSTQVMVELRKMSMFIS